MNWSKDGHFSRKPNEVIWSMDISNDAKVLFDIVASSIKQPVFITYKDVRKLTGWGKRRISAAIKTLVDRKIILFWQGGLRRKPGQEKKANEFSINPNRQEWDVGSLFRHPCASVPPWHREERQKDGVGSTTKPNSVPPRNTKEEERRDSPHTTTRGLSPVESPDQSTGGGNPVEDAEIERLASDPVFVAAFGSSEKARAHFIKTNNGSDKKGQTDEVEEGGGT